MKLTKLLFLAIAASSLAGCSFGGENVDTTLYELKITTNLDKAKDGLKAELRGERSAEEIEDLKKAGASQETIDKAGTCVDGTYYFFDQDPVNLYEPFLPGYEFLGWFKDNQFLGFLDTDYDGNPDYIWNMDNKNVTLEARFKLVNYTILYMDEDTKPATYKENPTTWNVEQGEVELGYADKTDSGLKFDGWTLAMGGGAFYEGYVTKLNEQFLVDSKIAKVSSNGTGALDFSLHENYSEIKHNVRLTFDNTIFDYIIVEVTPINGVTYTIEIEGSHFISSGLVEAEISHNAEVLIIPTLLDSDSYEIDGVYFGNYKISTEVPVREGLSTAYKIVASQDAEVELRAKAIKEVDEYASYYGTYHISKIVVEPKDGSSSVTYNKGDTNYFGMTLNDDFLKVEINNDGTFFYEGYHTATEKLSAAGTYQINSGNFLLIFYEPFDFGLLATPVASIDVIKVENTFLLTIENSVFTFNYYVSK